jgi:predicted enzyme related to lactoylglutathione lyase
MGGMVGEERCVRKGYGGKTMYFFGSPDCTWELRISCHDGSTAGVKSCEGSV